MRTTSTVLFLAVTAFAVKAGDFINLDFEQANTNYMAEVSYLGYIGRPEDLLPGWELASGDRPVSQVGYNLFMLGAETIYTLVSPDNPHGWPFPALGAYSLVLRPSSRPYHLSQTGEI
jgi:hypothetical protein